MIAELLQYDREVPPHWRDALASITPPHQRVSWLELVWESGSSERPIHRWVLYEAIPAHAVTWWQLEMLLEEPVESAGHQRILDYYLASGGCLLQPFWIVQGDHGGHRVEFSESEKKLLHYRGGSIDAPRAGSLPYADFDRRTIRQVMKWDRLRQGYATVQEARKRGDAALDRQFRQELVGWLEPQIQETVREQHGGIEYSTLLRETDQPPDFGELTELYIETGQLVA